MILLQKCHTVEIFFPKHAILACSRFWLCMYGTTTKCNKTSVTPQNTPPWVCCQTRVRFRLLTLRGSNDHSEVAYRLTHSRNETKLIIGKVVEVYKAAHLEEVRDWKCHYQSSLELKLPKVSIKMNTWNYFKFVVKLCFRVMVYHSLDAN